jgi:S-methylmethionine-dependent homocysteine/selenocysteine methylase
MIILDGGTGTLIQALGAPMSADTWCAEANLTHAEVVRAAHRQYLDAGAEVLIANTFATSPLLFDHLGRAADIAAIDAVAVRLAREASDGAVPIAGSFSVMRPVHRGGDRSNIERRWSETEARPLFEMKAAALADAGVDVIAMEMMRDGDRYSLWATQAAVATGLPVWLGISVEEDENGRLVGFNAGSDATLDEFIGPLLECGPAMVHVMHTAPPTTTKALSVVRAHWAGPLGAYAESGYFEMPDWRFVDVIDEASYAALARQWADEFGIEMIGGCCGIGPSHIAALRAEFPC